MKIILYNTLLKIKSKYDIVEHYYMDDSTPTGPVLFSGSLFQKFLVLLILKVLKNG
jgi:hypothetical protein